MISQSDKQRIAEELNKRITRLECPLCHRHQFSISDGYSMMPIQDEKKGVYLGGPVMPVISIVCTYCGFVSSHAIGVLGMLDDNK